MLQAIVGLLLGGICGFFVGIKALSFFSRNSNGAAVGFDIDSVASGFLASALGILGGAVIGLFIVLWLATE
jgi:hypothetical protein